MRGRTLRTAAARARSARSSAPARRCVSSAGTSASGDVHGRQHDAQRVGVEHHRDVRRAGQVRQQIGVAVPRQPGQPERLLVDRRGRDRVDVAALRVRRPRARWRRTPRGRRRRRARRARTSRVRRRRRTATGSHTREHARSRPRPARDLRPDAGGIAGGDRDARFHVTFGMPHEPQSQLPHAARRCRSRSGCRSRLRCRSRRARSPFAFGSS